MAQDAVITPNFVPRKDLYWWVTFQNIINLDILEAYVIVPNPLTGDFPIDAFFKIINDVQKRAAFGTHNGLIGRIPVFGGNPFDSPPGQLINIDLLNIIGNVLGGANNVPAKLEDKLLHPFGVDYTDPAKLKPILDAMIAGGQLTPDQVTSIINAIAQEQFQIQQANDKFNEDFKNMGQQGLNALLQVLDNFNTAFNSNFNIDNNGKVFNGGGGPAGLVLNNPGVPLQIFRILDFIEVYNYSGDPPGGRIVIQNAANDLGITYYADKTFTITINPINPPVIPRI